MCYLGASLLSTLEKIDVSEEGIKGVKGIKGVRYLLSKNSLTLWDCFLTHNFTAYTSARGREEMCRRAAGRSREAALDFGSGFC